MSKLAPLDSDPLSAQQYISLMSTSFLLLNLMLRLFKVF